MVNIKKFPRGILDQVISAKISTEAAPRAPGPGLKLQATSFKHQASSVKLSNQPFQTSSGKRQAPRCKRQA